MNRLRAVEVGIFTVASLVFLNSVYNLFTDGRFSSHSGAVAERRPMPVDATPGPDRKPAAPAASSGQRATAEETYSPSEAPYETKCQASGETHETSLGKLRIVGPFCGAPISARQPAGETGLLEHKVENGTTHYSATVFSDHSARRFSTDFIPLESGQNRILMEFRYRGGKMVPVEVVVTRK